MTREQMTPEQVIRRQVIREIVSGGQTGVDRAALDAALAAGVPCGGWCPKGRRAEDGRIPDRYPLRETESAGYPARTVRNVEDSDGTLILIVGGDARAASDGTRLTALAAAERGKPLLVLDPDTGSVDDVLDWARRHAIVRLNVAGPRASSAPDLSDTARRFMDALLGAVARQAARPARDG